MKTNSKRLKLLLKLIDIALVIISLSILLLIFYAIKGKENYVNLPAQVAASEKLKGLGMFAVIFAYFNVFKVFAVRILYGVILITIRKVIKSILDEAIFQEEQAQKIKKIAIYFLCFAGLLVLFNLALVFAIYADGKIDSFKGIVASVKMAVFESYLLTGLIALGLTHIFIAGMNLRKEQDLTI
jgi:hypothetical protein